MRNHSLCSGIQADRPQAPIKWDPVDVTPHLKDGRTVIPDKAIDSVKTNFIALKGPLAVSVSDICPREQEADLIADPDW